MEPVMKSNRKSRRQKLFFAAALAGATVLVAGAGVTVWAQTLGGTGVAIAGGAAIGAAAGAGLPTAGQVTRGVGNNRQNDQNAMIDEASNAGNAGAGAGAGAASAGGAQVTVRVQTQKPLNWGPQSGEQMVQQLVGSRYPAAGAHKRTASGQAKYSRRVSRLSPHQRSKMVLSKYRKPPVGYLSWYLPADRYKVTSKIWQVVTTPNDRFYYEPWAPAMKLRNPARVIGFHTWQDAMIAGYRPDPATRPEPAPKLAYFASLTRGPNLSRYFEFVYAGQVTPSALESHYQYVRYVAGEVGRHAHTRKLVGSTVEQVLGALTGNGSFPTQVGGSPRVVSTESNGQLAPAGIAPSPGDAGVGSGNREDQYNQFGNRAAGLARKPGQ
jgi:hypothetical protein